MRIHRPDHFTVLTDNLSATEAFYTEILGLIVGPRPDFKFPGIWLYAEDRPILHVVAVDALPEPRAGVLDHMAFRGEDLNGLLAKLTAAGTPYRLTRLPEPWETWQVFFHDPNGAKVEVDFDGQEKLDAQ